MTLPRSLSLLNSGNLAKRVNQAIGLLERCELCPRRCRVDRLKNEQGVCKTGRFARVASYGPHFGEEQPLVGTQGSGTIFLSSCNLRCCFCQNYDISHDQEDALEVDGAGLASIMLSLQDRGCRNINLVTPSHVLPQLLEALPIALDRGLQIPLIYNCSGYESSASLALLDGIIDIYLPDFKFWAPASAATYLQAADYPEIARQALLIMHRQVGDLVVDEDGLAVSGLLVRHLLMPGMLDETEAIITFIATALGTNTYLNIMDQYRPCGTASVFPELRSSIPADHYRQALQYAEQAGLRRLDQRDLATLLRRLRR